VSRDIHQVLQKHAEALMSIPGVCGTAVGEQAGRPCIRVFVVRRTDALDARLPDELEGFPVVVSETGPLRALDGETRSAQPPSS